MHGKLIFLWLIMLIWGCSDDTTNAKNARGGRVYGGELHVYFAEKAEDLFPLSSRDIYEQRVNNQLFESLLKIDNTGTKIIPSIAEKFEIRPDGKTYVFHIRKGVKFHDNPCFSDEKGREVTAKDVEFCLQFACSDLPENKIGNFLTNKIDGAKKFHKQTSKSLKGKSIHGLKVLDLYTIQITLVEPFIGFDKMMTHSNLGIFPREAYEKYGHAIGKNPVGTGPFQLEKWTHQGIVLKRNDSYWKKDKFGNKLPYLDQVNINYSTNKKEELLAFRKGKTDLILEIPADEIEYCIGTLKEAQAGKNIKHKVDSRSSMSVNFLGLANGKAPFNDVRVRQAFNLALDRNELVTHWMKGEGYPLLNGFVPAMKDYPTEMVSGFELDIPKAQQLLAQAGFANGQNFPEIDLYLNTQIGSSIYELSKGIQKQLKDNLNVNLHIKLCSLKEREVAIKSGKALIWKTGWVADYPDAANFLDLFYSGENSAYKTNPYQFSNPEYNALLEQAMKEKNHFKRNQLLVLCDQLLIDQAVVIPLFNDDFITMVNAKVRNFGTNSMEILDFSTIFIKEPTK